MSLILNVNKKVWKDLSKCSIKNRRNLERRIAELSSNWRPPDSVRMVAVRGNVWRISEGEYRIIYEVYENVVWILLVGKRNGKEVYKKYRRRS